MLGEYKNLNTDSGIIDIPSTLNYNNRVTEREFDNIYDSAKGFLRKSLENPKGYIKVHHGEFVNLKVDNLVVNGVELNTNETKFNSHESLENRFSWNLSSNPKITIDDLESFAHDTRMIVTVADENNPIEVGNVTFNNNVSLRDELDALERVVNGLAKNLTIKDSNDEIAEDDADYAYSADGSEDDGDTSADASVLSLEEITQKITSIEKRLTLIEFKLNIAE